MYEEEHNLENKNINSNNKEYGTLQPFSHLLPSSVGKNVELAATSF